MPRSFKWKAPTVSAGSLREPKNLLRVTVFTLLALNLVAALFAFRPWAAGPQEIAAEMIANRQQQLQKKTQIERLKILTTKAEKARTDGDKFMAEYFMNRRTASSTIVGELVKLSKEAGIKPREHSFVFEPVEGSDTLTMLTITGGYEGNYGDLVQYLNRLDHSPRFLIVENLTATPQQASAGQQATGVLNISVKLTAFIREGPSS